MHATITNKHIEVGPANVYDTSSSTFSLFGVGASLHLVLVFLSFIVHPLPCCHYYIFISISLSLSTCPNHHSLASLIFSLMFTTPALTFKVHDTNLIYPYIIGQQASDFEVRVSTNRYFHVAIGEMLLVTSKSTLENQHIVVVTGRTAPKATSVIVVQP